MHRLGLIRLLSVIVGKFSLRSSDVLILFSRLPQLLDSQSGLIQSEARNLVESANGRIHVEDLDAEDLENYYYILIKLKIQNSIHNLNLSFIDFPFILDSRANSNLMKIVLNYLNPFEPESVNYRSATLLIDHDTDADFTETIVNRLMTLTPIYPGMAKFFAKFYPRIQTQ